MVRKLQDIYERAGVGPKAAAGWLAAWLVALTVLTVIPHAGATTETATAGNPGVYYSFASVTTTYPDLDSGLSVQVRSLRPVMGR